MYANDGRGRCAEASAVCRAVRGHSPPSSGDHNDDLSRAHTTPTGTDPPHQDWRQDPEDLYASCSIGGIDLELHSSRLMRNWRKSSAPLLRSSYGHGDALTEAQVLTDHAHGRRPGEVTDNDRGARLTLRVDQLGAQPAFASLLRPLIQFPALGLFAAK